MKRHQIQWENTRSGTTVQMFGKNCYDRVKPIIKSTKLQIVRILPKFLRQSYRRTRWRLRFGQDLKKFRKNFPLCLGKLQAKSSPCKTFLFVFFRVEQKFGRIENFAYPKVKDSRMPLVRADLRRNIARIQLSGLSLVMWEETTS